MKVIIQTIVYTFIFMAIAQVFPNILYIKNFQSALIASFILVLLNLTIRPILKFISFPITVITLGLFTIIINAVVLEIASHLMRGNFTFNNFGGAIVVAIILAICSAIIGNYSRK